MELIYNCEQGLSVCVLGVPKSFSVDMTDVRSEFTQWPIDHNGLYCTLSNFNFDICPGYLIMTWMWTDFCSVIVLLRPLNQRADESTDWNII